MNGETRRKIRTNAVLITHATVLAIFGLLLIGIAYRAETEARKTKAALCVYKNDLAERLSATDEFIQRNPNGIPGFTRAEIERGRGAQAATLQSLNALDCSGDDRPAA